MLRPGKPYILGADGSGFGSKASEPCTQRNVAVVLQAPLHDVSVPHILIRMSVIFHCTASFTCSCNRDHPHRCSSKTCYSCQGSRLRSFMTCVRYCLQVGPCRHGIFIVVLHTVAARGWCRTCTLAAGSPFSCSTVVFPLGLTRFPVARLSFPKASTPRAPACDVQGHGSILQPCHARRSRAGAGRPGRVLGMRFAVCLYSKSFLVWA